LAPFTASGTIGLFKVEVDNGLTAVAHMTTHMRLAVKINILGWHAEAGKLRV
jgi:hypothetical protein